MEEKNNDYTIWVSDSFNRETEETIHYIAYNLNNPTAAYNFAEKLNKTIHSLVNFQKSHPKWRYQDGNESIYRFVRISSYLAFYVIFDENRIVEVIHLLYEHSNINERLQDLGALGEEELNRILDLDIDEWND